MAVESPEVTLSPTAIQEAIRDFFTLRHREAEAADPRLAATVAELESYVLSGGKRIRPTFAWWGWRGAGGPVESPDALAVLRAISALELIQASALIHDDLMDASATRRGRPTVHVEFARKHAAARWRGQPARFGAAAAILLGDLALAWADDMLHAAGLSPAALRRAAPAWRAMRTEVLGGQYLDVLHQSTGDTTVRAALQIDRYKTAAYTVERPLHMGVAFADAKPDTVEAVKTFGADIGVAFQLRDDLLGMFGDTEATGKPAGDDLREGKRTLLMALGLGYAARAGRHADADVLRGALGDPGLGPETLARVRELLADLGAVAELERRIETLTSSALAALDSAGLAEPGVTRLRDLAIAATRRDR